MPVTLFLGGTRSDKSRPAESKAESLSNRRIYIATAEAGDAEMAERIARYQKAIISKSGFHHSPTAHRAWLSQRFNGIHYKPCTARHPGAIQIHRRQLG